MLFYVFFQDKAHNVCHLCVEGLHVAYNFKRHYERAIKNVWENKANDLRCETPIGFASDANTEDTMSLSDEEFRGFQPIIDDGNKINELLTERRKLQKPSVCDICLKRFKNKYIMKYHAKRHLTKIGQYHCNKCNAYFLVSTHFKNHTCTN